VEFGQRKKSQKAKSDKKIQKAKVDKKPKKGRK